MELCDLKSYQLIEKKDLTDIGSVGYVLRHIKSGARVMLIENEDDNKVFNIIFRTTPTDSTGVPHIIEHTVLCGSEKYPSKDPFVELAKGSMNTFLNAMTFPDMTMYPVASCNDQDFRNLMDVYLDAVFHPNIYRNEQIFRQEGWSYQIEQAEDPICLNGVVYNEMKGAFSSPDDVVGRKIMNTLFPDTTYGVESGGDPDHIPELTYEQFLDFHRKYYDPSNAYIYLYGKMDFAERLDYIDRAYLSHFEMAQDGEMGENGPKYSEISLQKPFEKPVRHRISYPAAESDPIENNAYLTYNLVIGESSDVMLSNAFAVVEYALLATPGAPLKKALLDAGVAKDVIGSYDAGTRQPVFSVAAKMADENREEEFLSIIRTTLTKLAEEGLNQKALEAAVNTMEFRYREADYGGYPKGLIYSIDVFDSWLYREDQTFDYLLQLDIYKALREKIGTGYYEDLIRKYLLENPHCSIVTAVPERGLAARVDEKTAQELAAFKAGLTEDEISKLIDETKKLRAFQETPSTPEELAKIPMLTREDLGKRIRPILNEIMEKDDVRMVYHDVQTNGIAYIQLYLDASCIAQEDYRYFGILKHVLGDVSTEHYSYDELTYEIGRKTGGIGCGISIQENRENCKKAKCALSARIATLPDQIDFSFDIVREILCTSKIDDEKRLKEILQQVRSRLYVHLTGAGHQTAARRAASYFCADALISDEIRGLAFYQTVCDYEEHFQEKKEELIENLKRILRSLLRRNAFLVSFTGDRREAEHVLSAAAAFAENLDGESAICENLKTICDLKYEKKNEGIRTGSKVQYVAVAGNYKRNGLPYSGHLSVLKMIMNYDYLWTNLRVVGGAYGCGISLSHTGYCALSSYRDPHLKNTLEVYRESVPFLKDFRADERDMTKYVIGAVAGIDAPLTPAALGSRSMKMYIAEMTEELLQQDRDELLSTSEADIRALAPYLEAVLSENALCVLGNEEKINAEKDLFGEVISL